MAELRASDADRERTIHTLRQASADGRLTVPELEERLETVYAVSTCRELDQLVEDVTVAVGQRHSTGLTVREGEGGERWIVAVMGGHDRRGRWRVGERCRSINVMGGNDLDLCEAELASPAVRLTVFALMGGSEIRVPHGVRVEVSSLALMGGNDVRLGDEDPIPGSPVIRLRLISIMGGSTVRRGRKRTRAERRRDRARKAE
jgi:hypothetical protein